jgi:hypothetical protein
MVIKFTIRYYYLYIFFQYIPIFPLLPVQHVIPAQFPSTCVNLVLYTQYMQSATCLKPASHTTGASNKHASNRAPYIELAEPRSLSAFLGGPVTQPRSMWYACRQEVRTNEISYMRHVRATKSLKRSNLNNGDSFVLSHLPTVCGKRHLVNIYTLAISRRPSINFQMSKTLQIRMTPKFYSPTYLSESQEI